MKPTEFKDFPNKRKADFYRRNYAEWKKDHFKLEGFFPIFQSFKESFLLRRLSGNAVKLYLYLGLMSGNETGETWVSIPTMAKYFEKTERTISSWLKELEDARLIKRMQMEPDGVAHTFLMGYSSEEFYQKALGQLKEQLKSRLNEEELDEVMKKLESDLLKRSEDENDAN